MVWYILSRAVVVALGLVLAAVTNNNKLPFRKKSTSSSTTTSTTKAQQQSVLIVGGGLSGLAAARALVNDDTDIDNAAVQVVVTLLESKDRFGGRLHSVAMNDNSNTNSAAAVVVDLGAMYWHGESPIYRQLQREFASTGNAQQEEEECWPTVSTGGTSMHPGGQAQAVWMMLNANTNANTNNDDGNNAYTELTEQEIKQTEPLFDDWMELLQASYRAHAKATTTASGSNTSTTHATGATAPELLQVWRDAGLEALCAPTTITNGDSNDNDTAAATILRQERLCNAWLRFQMTMTFELDHGLTLTEHAMEGLLNDWDWIEYEGHDPISVHGSSDLVRLLVQRIQKASAGTTTVDLQTNQRVERIVIQKSKDKASTCRVTTSSGVEYEADVCIVTLPLGVLQATAADMFVPSLPERKQVALDRAGVGILNTVAVQWKKPICRANATAYYLMGAEASPLHDGDNGQRASNPLRHGFICSGNLRGHNPYITQFYLGETNHPFDNTTYWKEQAWKVVRDVVSFAVEMDDIVDLQLSQWHTDQDIRGSYSAPTTLSRGNADRRLLAEPIDNVVFFAGEHTHYQGRYQSMDGAYETGERAAREVMERLAELRRTKGAPSATLDALKEETCQHSTTTRGKV